MDIYQIRDLVMLTQDRLTRARLLCDELRSTHKIATNMADNWSRGDDGVLFQRFRTATIQGLMADVMALPISDEFQVDLPRLLRAVSTYNDYLHGHITVTTADAEQQRTLVRTLRTILPPILEMCKRCHDELRIITGLPPWELTWLESS